MLRAVITVIMLCCLPFQAATEQPEVVAEVVDASSEQAASNDTLASKPAEDSADKQIEASRPVALRSNNERQGAGISLGKMALSLLIVVLVVLALGWTFKKLTLRLPGSKHIKIISSLPLGPKERLLVVEIQGKQRVLGVTPQQINMLFELENPLPEEKLASDFHTQLQSFLKK